MTGYSTLCLESDDVISCILPEKSYHAHQWFICDISRVRNTLVNGSEKSMVYGLEFTQKCISDIGIF